MTKKAVETSGTSGGEAGGRRREKEAATRQQGEEGEDREDDGRKRGNTSGDGRAVSRDVGGTGSPH